MIISQTSNYSINIKSVYFVFLFILFFVLNTNESFAQGSKRYGVGELFSGGELADSTKSVFIIYWLKGNGESTLTSSGRFLPLKDHYTIEGNINHAIELPDDKVQGNEDIDKAIVNGWSYVKKNNKRIGNIAMKLIGQTIIPISRELLELIVSPNTVPPRGDEIFPEDGKLHLWLVSFNEHGAVVQANKEGGFYVIEYGDNFISLADNSHFTIIDATPAIKAEAQRMLNAMD